MMNEIDGEASGIRSRAPLVLVADDFPDAQAIYGFSLRREGYRVAFASTGGEAVERARALHPDVVLMDVWLRGMDGCAATRELRLDSDLAHLAVLVVSGHVEPEQERHAYECGCDLFLSKACPLEAILSIVRGFIVKSGRMPASNGV